MVIKKAQINVILCHWTFSALLTGPYPILTPFLAFLLPLFLLSSDQQFHLDWAGAQSQTNDNPNYFDTITKMLAHKYTARKAGGGNNSSTHTMNKSTKLKWQAAMEGICMYRQGPDIRHSNILCHVACNNNNDGAGKTGGKAVGKAVDRQRERHTPWEIVEEGREGGRTVQLSFCPSVCLSICLAGCSSLSPSISVCLDGLRARMKMPGKFGEEKN